MSECTGNPNNCGFCGVSGQHFDWNQLTLQTGEARVHTGDHCAKTECRGCTADPGACEACQGMGGCVSTECTG